MGILIQALTGLRFTVDVKKSKKLAEQAYDRYNLDRKRADKLKSGDLQLLNYLIEIAAADLRDRQLGEKLGIMQHLPFFRVSNPLCARKIGVTEKTVYNRRKRLEKAGLLTGYRFRTSGQKYDLRLSTTVLHIQRIGEKENVSELFYPRLDAPPGSAAYAENFTALCNQYFNGEPIKQKQQESGVENPSGNDFDKDFMAGLTAELEPVGAGNTPDNPPPTENQKRGTKNSAGPKFDKFGRRTEAPIFWGQVTEGLKPAEERQLRNAVSRLWAKAAGWNWFNTGRVAQSQAELAQIRIAEWFLLYYPSAWKALEKRFSWQIKRVAGYVKWREANEAYQKSTGTKAPRRSTWFPPPGDYFDIRRNEGMCFAKTNAWWKHRLERLAEQEQEAALGKAMSAIRVAGYENDPYAVEVTYGKWLKELEPLGDDVITQFVNYTISLYGTNEDFTP